MVEKIEVDLNNFDDEGGVVGSTKVEMSREQISDIIDHAAQLIILQRQGLDIGETLQELESALSVADVVDDVCHFQP